MAKYVPDELEKYSPHVAVVDLDNGKTAFSRVCVDHYKADHVRMMLLLEYRWHAKDSYTIPLKELPRLFPQFKGKALPQIVKMLGGYEDVKFGRDLSKKRKSGKTPSPFHING